MGSNQAILQRSGRAGIEIITSPQNEKVKYARSLRRRKVRRREGRFLAEGERCVDEIANAAKIDFVLYSPSFRDSRSIIRRVERAFPVSENLMGQIATTESHQGIVAVVAKRDASLQEILNRDLILVLDGIRDPGNLGTILRTAEAAGVGGAILLGGCVDAYNPKVVRASAGAIVGIPILESSSNVISSLKESGFQIVVGDVRGNVSYVDMPHRGRIALVLGNEADGVSRPILEAASAIVSIPIRGRAESLNVAVACGILLFKILELRGDGGNV
ncbi:MAG: TrmH family RNA methyltransferase [bacterium]